VAPASNELSVPVNEPLVPVYVLSTYTSLPLGQESGLSFVPHSNPDPVGIWLASSNEADRVAPVALTLEDEPVVTVAVRPPEFPSPDSLHS